MPGYIEFGVPEETQVPGPVNPEPTQSQTVAATVKPTAFKNN